jgi:sugar O-acyltransferase (sialic acid O-acetyltransferase NeuD family)
VKDLILIAASGLAREVISANQSDYRVVGILDDNAALRGTIVGGVEVLGGIDQAHDVDADLLICVGSGVGRKSIVSRMADLGVTSDRFATLIDDSVHIPGNSSVGAGSTVLAQVAATSNVTIGRHVVIMPNVTLTHDNEIDDFATLTAGVSLGGSVVIGEAAYLGMNASVRQNVRIGANAVIGMGAAVLRDVPCRETWVGVPARSLVNQPKDAS